MIISLPEVIHELLQGLRARIEKILVGKRYDLALGDEEGELVFSLI
jgi:hypothetical protein